MAKMLQKVIKVLDHPATFIMVDADKDDDEEKKKWLEKHKTIRPLSQGQINREIGRVRGGKVMQRKQYK